MILRRLFPVALLLSLLLGAFVLPASAQDASESEQPSEEEFSGKEHFVEVGDDGFFPVELTIKPGDRVIWVWVDEGPHSVTASPDATNARAFDSHPDCPDLLGGGCGTNGFTYAVDKPFRNAGVYRYSSRHPDDAETHAGAINVLAPAPTVAPAPTAQPTEQPSASPEPTEEPSATPAPADPGPTPDPTPDPNATGTETATATPSPTPQRGSIPNFAQNSRPVIPSQPLEQPIVAGQGTPTPTASPTFESFPVAADPLSGDDGDDDVAGAVEIPDLGSDSPSGRLMWGILGGSLLAATLGAFGKIVLFSEIWATELVS